MKKDIKLIQSVQRAINILNCFNKNLELSLNSISEKVDLNINTTRGLVNTLVANELLFHNTLSNTYSIGNFFLLKSNLVLKNNINRAKDLSADLLYELANKFNSSCRLQIIASDNIFTANTINPDLSHYILTSTQDANFPLHATSSGKLLLKYKEKNLAKLNLEKFTDKTITSVDSLKIELDSIEKNGYALEMDEIGCGISSVAVPIFDNNGFIFGTISATAISPIIKEQKEKLIKGLKDAAKILEERLFLM